MREVRAHSIVGEDGVEREVDAIVFGTGFHVTDIPAAHRVRGRGGKLLDDIWHGSPRAYLGSTIAGFPNLFFLLGPNTGLGHSSMVYMIESQIAHVMAALNHMHARRAETIEIRREAQDRYNAEIDGKLEGTVWNTGCASWYIDHTGRNSTIWPDWTWRFRRRARELRPDDYALDVGTRAESWCRHEGRASPAPPAASAPRRPPSCARAARPWSGSTSCPATTSSSATCATRRRSTPRSPRRSSASAGSTCSSTTPASGRRRAPARRPTSARSRSSTSTSSARGG